MKNIKKDIPALLGLIGTASVALISGGLVNPTLTNIGASLAANFLTDFTPAKIKKWFVDIHPNDLNHSIKKLFIKSVNDALYNISILFSETNADENAKKEVKELIKTLQKQLPDILSDNNQLKINEAKVQHFLYEKDENAICSFIENKFADFGITEPFKSFLAQNLPAQIQLCFGEGLKDPANHNAWVAFQRMLVEEIRNDVKQIADTQQSIKDDLSDLKFTKSGLLEEQITKIRQLIKILNDKDLIKVKIQSGVNQSLKSIESKANKIIQITTQTNIDVNSLKSITKNIEKKQKINSHILYSLLIIIVLIIVGILLNRYFRKKAIIDNTSPTTTIIDASPLYKNILLDVSLMDYQDVRKQMTEEEYSIFEWSYPEFRYKDTIVNQSYLVVPQNEYYNNYYNKHYINAPLLAYWADCSMQTHACYLDVKIVNNSDATIILDKLFIDIEESKTDKTPFLYVCTEDTYTSHILFVNEGYEKWEGFDFEFSLLNINKSFNGEYMFKTYVPYFEDTYRLDLHSYIQSVGFNYDKLLEETDASYEIENGDDFIFLYGVNENSLSKFAKYAEPFQFVKGHFDNYDIHAKLVGQISFRGFPLNIDIQAEVPITTEAGFGGVFEFNSGYDIQLRNEGKNYQIKHPISISLKPNEAERIALKFTATKTSKHKLNVALKNINGLDIKSNTINLSIFQPRTFQEILDNKNYNTDN